MVGVASPLQDERDHHPIELFFVIAQGQEEKERLAVVPNNNPALHIIE